MNTHYYYDMNTYMFI